MEYGTKNLRLWEEHSECRRQVNSALDGHKVEIIARHGVSSLKLNTRSPLRLSIRCALEPRGGGREGTAL
jgi:hypothetical protein